MLAQGSCGETKQTSTNALHEPPPPPPPPGLLQASVTTLSISGLAAGATYRFVVSAFNSFGNGAQQGAGAATSADWGGGGERVPGLGRGKEGAWPGGPALTHCPTLLPVPWPAPCLPCPHPLPPWAPPPPAGEAASSLQISLPQAPPPPSCTSPPGPVLALTASAISQTSAQVRGPLCLPAFPPPSPPPRV
jgi:hypothetical protein